MSMSPLAAVTVDFWETLVRDPGSRDRFQQEARAVASLPPAAASCPVWPVPRRTTSRTCWRVISRARFGAGIDGGPPVSDCQTCYWRQATVG